MHTFSSSATDRNSSAILRFDQGSDDSDAYPEPRAPDVLQFCSALCRGCSGRTRSNAAAARSGPVPPEPVAHRAWAKPEPDWPHGPARLTRSRRAASHVRRGAPPCSGTPCPPPHPTPGSARPRRQALRWRCGARSPSRARRRPDPGPLPVPVRRTALPHRDSPTVPASRGPDPPAFSLRAGDLDSARDSESESVASLPVSLLLVVGAAGPGGVTAAAAAQRPAAPADSSWHDPTRISNSRGLPADGSLSLQGATGDSEAGSGLKWLHHEGLYHSIYTLQLLVAASNVRRIHSL
jgi:hypothetical protein